MIAYKLTFSRSPVMIVILALFTLLTLTYSEYPAMNRKCNVYFNYTHEHEATKYTFLNQLKRYESCWESTLKSTVGRNLTSTEENDCHSKCAQIAEGSVHEDGTFNTGFLEKTRREYANYSNATASFIDKVLDLLSACAVEVAATFKLVETSSEAVPSECLINGLYHNCWKNVFWTLVDNSTNEEICGNKKK